MSKRPAFQFYPGDWQKNAKLRRCSPAARGVWVDVLCLFHDAEEYGLLRWPLKDIANAAGASSTHVRELVDKGVLKGADKEAPAYVYRPKHAGKAGEPVTLVIADGGPVWYSSRMVRDEYVRQRRGESTRFDTANQPNSRPPKGGNGERQGDGPSTSSSPSGSEAIASGAAAAPPPVDKSPEAKRAAWRDCGRWMVASGMAEVTAREVMGKVLKDFPAVAIDAFAAAAQQPETPDPKAYLIATAQRLAGERKDPVTVPSDAADRTKAELERRDAEWRAAQAAGGGKVPAAVLEAKTRIRALASPQPAAEGADA